MNSRLLLSVLLTAWLSVVAVAARPPPNDAPAGPVYSESLVRFNLKFPGGTPQELGAAIAQASGKPCNLIVTPTIRAHIPPLELANVTVPELFTALLQSSVAAEITAEGNYRTSVLLNFRTAGNPVTDQSIWYLSRADQLPATQPARVCRFYSLARYLGDYTIDDITTVLVTAWGLEGVEKPQMTFHKETKLLIVVGEESRHAAISQALKELDKNRPQSPSPALPTPPPQPKTDAGK